jgi:hypothetical protein
MRISPSDRHDRRSPDHTVAARGGPHSAAIMEAVAAYFAGPAACQAQNVSIMPAKERVKQFGCGFFSRAVRGSESAQGPVIAQSSWPGLTRPSTGWSANGLGSQRLDAAGAACDKNN